MLRALLAIEWLVIALAAGLLWRRARPATPPFRGPLRVLGGALLVQFGLFAALVPILSWATADAGAAAGRLASAAAAASVVQLLRGSCLLVALAAWLSVLRRVAPRGSLFALAFLLLLAACQIAFPSGRFFAGLALLIVLLRIEWTRAVRGRTRAALAGGALLLVTVALNVITWSWSVPGVDGGEIAVRLSATEMTVEGALPAEASSRFRLAGPWSLVVRTALTALVIQSLAAILRGVLSIPAALFPRLRLRGLSLERRFAVTYALVRIVPAVVLVTMIALGLPLALGMHKTVRVRAALREEILRAVPLADAVLDSAGTTAPPSRADLLVAAMDAALRRQAPSLRTAHVVVRGSPAGLGPTAAGRADGEADETADVDEPPPGASSPFAISVATPGTPGSIAERSPFKEFPADTLGGLIEAEGAIYLATALVARRVDTAPPALVAEVLVPVDSSLVNRLARDLGVEIEIRTLPRTAVARTATTLSLSPGDTTVAVPEIRVTSLAAPEREPRGFWRRPRYVGQVTTALGDWLHLPISGPGVVLTLRASAEQVLHALGSAFFMLIDSSIGLPRVALALLLLGIAEIVAVRMGRGITRGVLEDVSALTDAAGRLGSGDLRHRVAVRGKDELASLAQSFNTMAESLEAQRAELLEKERLEEDLAVARDIQSRFLPQAPPDVPGLDMAGLSVPSREVGGDLFYFVPLDVGRVGLTIGDVSGKSIPAALLMFSTLAALRAQTQFRADVDVTLANVNRLLVDDIEPGRFVTFFYGVVDPAGGTLRYACAGHNPPLKMSPRGAVEWLEEAGVPLGILPDARYRAATTPLAPDDILVLYSDGITEAEGPATVVVDGIEEPDQFGSERLVEAVRAHRDRSAREIVEGIERAVRRFAADVPQSDDITLIVVKVTDPARPAAAAP